MFENRQFFSHRVQGLVISSAFLLLTFLFPGYWDGLLLLAVALLLLAQLRIQSGLASTNSVYTLSGFVYITVLLSALLALRENFASWAPGMDAAEQHLGGWFVIVLLAAIWICDTAAYFGGKTLGKHKLAPNISPNKTIEGALFGLLFGILSFWGLASLWLEDLPIAYVLASGLIVGVFGQVGDLLESRFKRDAGVKDTSTLLPGHGGLLDRFDSLIFVSPFLCFCPFLFS